MYIIVVDLCHNSFTKFMDVEYDKKKSSRMSIGRVFEVTCSI